MQASKKFDISDTGSDNNTGLIPDFKNMTLMLFEPEKIQVKYDISNINLTALAADPDRFFLRTEEKYGLYELNLDKIDLGVSFDYNITMIPPIFVDKGSFKFQSEDISLNSVWNLNLNSTRNFFTVIISHVLVQINPDKFKLNIDSYADLTQLLNQQIDLIIEFTLNEILAYIRYDVAKMLESIINGPELNNIFLSLD